MNPHPMGLHGASILKAHHEVLMHISGSIFFTPINEFSEVGLFNKKLTIFMLFS